MKIEVDKLDINIKKLVTVPSSLNNLKTKVEDLGVDKTFPVDLKKLRYVVSKEVVKKTVYKKLNTKVNNLENKICDASTLIQSNHYNQITKIWRKHQKFGDVENKLPDISSLISTTILDRKIGEVENKISDISGLVKKRIKVLKYQTLSQSILLLLIIINLLAQ